MNNEIVYHPVSISTNKNSILAKEKIENCLIFRENVSMHWSQTIPNNAKIIFVSTDNV